MHKTLWRSKCTISIYKHLRMCFERKRHRRKATAVISCYREAYTYQQTNYEEQRLTDSQAYRNSATSMPTLGASERLYQPINLFTYCYLHAVQNTFICNTDYKLGHKPILIWRTSHDTELK